MSSFFFFNENRFLGTRFFVPPPQTNGFLKEKSAALVQDGLFESEMEPIGSPYTVAVRLVT